MGERVDTKFLPWERKLFLPLKILLSSQNSCLKWICYSESCPTMVNLDDFSSACYSDISTVMVVLLQRKSYHCCGTISFDLNLCIDAIQRDPYLDPSLGNEGTQDGQKKEENG
ncbi:hypothetical protein HAX54_023628 [Datura stramonium]|uniref:Uncharacterized protein n=1 Tax=Datura stramonium TaxID=4076 RepID=A0ABS8S518_DATST|nr:hypothetical protein [Datura stramonium]